MSRQNTTSAAEAFALYAEEYDQWFDTAEGRLLFTLEHAAVLLQPPSANLQKEEAHDGLIEDAGFVCILARKT